MSMKIPENLLKELSANKQVAYAAYNNLMEASNTIDKYHTTTQKELLSEFRGYQVQISSISAAVIGIVGGFANSIDCLMKIGLGLLAAAAVAGVVRSVLSTESSARGTQTKYNEMIETLDDSMRPLEDFLNGDDDSDEAMHEAYKTQLEKHEKIKGDQEKVRINRNWWAYAVMSLFALGVVLMTISLIA